MADFPDTGQATMPVVVGHSFLFPELAALGSTVTTGAWPVSNLGIFFPMPLSKPMTVTQMFIANGGTVSGNIDVGIYDAGGNKIVAMGSTAQAGTSATQTFNITDTLLNPGLYYVGCALDNTTGIVGANAPSISAARAMGVLQATSAFSSGLTATVTFAALASAFIPAVYLTTASVI